MAESFFELSATANNGKSIDFGIYKGKVVLVVNTASKCGFTPQYKGLEELYRAYKDRGFVILAFPCDQFAHQEPGSDADIAAFCQINYGVSFPLMAKIEVNGEGTHPVFRFLKSKTSGILGDGIKWNFTKFLVDRDGKTFRPDREARRPCDGDRGVALGASLNPSGDMVQDDLEADENENRTADNLGPFLEDAFQYVRVSSFLVIDRRSSRASQAGRAPISLRARAVK